MLICARILAFLIVALSLTMSAHAQRVAVNSNPVVYFAPATACTPGYFGVPTDMVTTCGSDVTGDGTKNAPWETLQHAIDIFEATYDFAGKYAPTLQLACAPSPGQFYYPGVKVSSRMVGQPGGIPPLFYGDGTPGFPIGKYAPIFINGCPENQLGAFLNPGAGGRPSDIGLTITGGAVVKVRGISIDTTFALQDTIDVFNGTLDIADVVFGNASNDLKRIHIGVAWGGTLAVNGTLTVAGNASSFIETGSGGTVYWNNNGNPASPMKVRILGKPKFSNGMFNSRKGDITVANVKFVKSSLDANRNFVDTADRGEIEGTAAVVKMNGTIDTATGNGVINPEPPTCDPNYFPLNTVAGGTQVDAQDNGVCR